MKKVFLIQFELEVEEVLEDYGAEDAASYVANALDLEPVDRAENVTAYELVDTEPLKVSVDDSLLERTTSSSNGESE